MSVPVLAAAAAAAARVRQHRGAEPRTCGRRTGRNISARDTFLYGSGTKPFIAARIFQLIEAGKLNLTSNVAEQIDPLLHAMNGSSMVQLFGPPASAITVGELLRMASGLGVMESDPFDALTWCARARARACACRTVPSLAYFLAQN